MCVCVGDVCMCACVYVLCVHVSMCAVYVACSYVCVHVCMSRVCGEWHRCMCVCACVCGMCACVCVYVCMCECMCGCTCVCICVCMFKCVMVRGPRGKGASKHPHTLTQWAASLQTVSDGTELVVVALTPSVRELLTGPTCRVVVVGGDGGPAGSCFWGEGARVHTCPLCACCHACLGAPTVTKPEEWWFSK